MNHQRALVWSIRLAGALGLASLTLTGEISASYIVLCWGAWAIGCLLDTRPREQQRLRSLETVAVLGLISVFVLDFWFWGNSIFVSVAHFLMLFQAFKLLGPKTRKDCLQILIVSFFQVLSA